MSPASLPDDDLTRLIRRVEAGDPEASSDLWAECFPRLLAYCRRRLPDHMRRVLDEEDVALSAFKSFCLGAQRDALGEIHGRDELWKLLYCIAARKAHGYVRQQTRQKRGGGNVSGESVFMKAGQTDLPGIENVADNAADPITIAQLAQDCEALFDQLDDEMLQTIALLRMEGYSVAEIAERIGCAKRSVERRLNLIRSIWKASVDSPDPS
ncbi:MAG: ECF-type sigma factor [Planctomycetota bacterium]